MTTIKEAIKQVAYDLGADICGIAAIDRFQDAPKGFSPTDIYKDCRSVLSFGVALPKGLLQINPRLVYSHFNGNVICRKVDQIAFDIAQIIEREFKGIAVPVPCDAPNEYWDEETQTAIGLISMKHTAVACGLGQLGKNTLLLTPQYGNRLTLGAVLLNLELESDDLCKSICIPNCHKCIDACPAHAINEGNVNQGLCRKNTYGMTERGFGTCDCNQCRSKCPLSNGTI